jgi:hypothetical protein
LRIRGTPRKDAPPDLKTVVVFYVGMESMDTCGAKCKLASSAQVGAEEDTSIHAANLWVEHPQLGTAGLHIPASVGENGRHEGMVVKSMKYQRIGYGGQIVSSISSMLIYVLKYPRYCSTCVMANHFAWR